MVLENIILDGEGDETTNVPATEGEKTPAEGDSPAEAAPATEGDAA